MNGWEFMTKHAAVVPFSKGTPVYVDGMLSTLYYKTKERGLLDLVLCGDNPNHDQFVRMFDESKKILQILCEIKDQGTAAEQCIPVGYSWVEASKGIDGHRAAMCGFAFIKRSRYMRDLGMLGLAYWLKGMKIDVLHGVMLEQNQAAIRYAEELGFVRTAEVPKFHFFRGELVGAVEVMIEANDYLSKFEKWFENRRLN